jgi:hypothetical protein
MSFKLPEWDAAVLIESCGAFACAAGLPAYMGWHGDAAWAFIAYATAAGLAITTGLLLLHESMRPAFPEGVLAMWGLQSAMVTVLGGSAYSIATLLHGSG